MCRRHIFALALALAASAVVVFLACDGGARSRGPVKFDSSDTVQVTSYMLGRDIGKTVNSLDADIDVDILLAAVREAVKDKLESQLNDSATGAVDLMFRQILQARRELKAKEQSEAAKAAGEAFLAANKGNPGVTVTESGLQYIVITEGTGASPTAADRVKVHYHGTLIDGTVFDSSVNRGEPAEFPLNGVIRGWTEALQLMKAGGKYKIFVPWELGYGERGMPRSPIGPYTALIFEIELLEIAQPAAAAEEKGKTAQPAAATEAKGKTAQPAAAAEAKGKTAQPAAAAEEKGKAAQPAAAAEEKGKAAQPAAAAEEKGVK